MARCWAFVVWVWVPVRGPLCLFWRKTHTKGLRVRFPMRLEEVERRKVPERNRVVDITGLSTEVWGSRMLGCVDPEAGLANVRGWVSIPGDFVGILLEYTLALAHRCTESYAKESQTYPFLRLEQTQVRVCSLFFHPIGYVCCVLCVHTEI